MRATGSAKERQFVNALARGLEILRAFRPGDVALGNQELAERTGLPKPTVSRLTRTLRELDYLDTDPRSGGYTLGHSVMSLGQSALASFDPNERSTPFLEDLASETGVVSAMATLSGAEASFVRVCRGDAPVSVNAGIGQLFPAMRSGFGLAILASMSPARRRETLTAIRGDMAPEAFKAVGVELDRAIEDLARDGFCRTVGLWRPTVCSVAAPVPGGLHELSIGVCAPAHFSKGPGWIARIGETVAEKARRLSEQLGQDKSAES